MKQLALFPDLADVRPAPEIPAAPELLTEEALVFDLATRICRRGEQQVVAAELGVSQGAVSNVLTAGRGIGPKLAGALGYRKVIRFERVREDGGCGAAFQTGE